MIIKELYALYERLLKQGVYLPRMGEVIQKVSFVIRLKSDGRLVEHNPIERIEELNEKGRLVPISMCVLSHEKTNSVEPGFLCDKLENIFGMPAKKSVKLDKDGKIKLTQAEKYFESTCALYSKAISNYSELYESDVIAVLKFLEILKSKNKDDIKEILNNNGVNEKDLTSYAVYMIYGNSCYVHEEKKIKDWWHGGGEKYWYDMKETKGQCLISGKYAAIPKTHVPRIPEVSDRLATLVSYNCNAFESYAKSQSENAPVSTQIVHGYCNALNYLLGRNESKVKIGDATTVFWTDAPANTYDDIEILLGSCLDPKKIEAEDGELLTQVRNTLQDIAKGKFPEDNLQSNTRFFILGLSPNAARLSVRFFSDGTLLELLENLSSHYQGLELLHVCEKCKNQDIISPKDILFATVKYDKYEEKMRNKVSPLYEGLLMNSILQRKNYSDSIALAILRRIRIDGMTLKIREEGDFSKYKYTYIRCAFLKAWLNRKKSNYQIKTMLDEENNQPGYVLGRLFALLQKTQTDGHPNLNRTLQDAYYSSASSTPGVVFPRLLKLYNHHIAKLDRGRRIAREKQVQQVIDLLEKIPSRLNIEQQGFFALGFYHQTQAFFKKLPNDNL